MSCQEQFTLTAFLDMQQWMEDLPVLQLEDLFLPPSLSGLPVWVPVDLEDGSVLGPGSVTSLLGGVQGTPDRTTTPLEDPRPGPSHLEDNTPTQPGDLALLD